MWVTTVRLTAFFSWQSDTLSNDGRNFIEKALKAAVARIARDVTVEEAVRDGLAVDKDTKDVPGSPPIFDTILRKISKAAVFVPDLTFVGTRRNGEPTPNPNVLIEYGWALKSLGYYQIVPVMNEAQGGPGSMPFDMAHLRFPITYNLPEGASAETRKAEQEQLTRKLEKALRTILESEEFRATLPKEPEPPPFPQKEPMNGRARFRPRNQPLGICQSSVAALLGQGVKPTRLVEGSAMWLRLIPSSDPGRKWSFHELKDLSMSVAAVLPLTSDTGSTGLVRGEDGCGWYSLIDPETAASVCYVFNTGETWAIDARQSQLSESFALDEKSFTKSLADCCLLLEEHLGIPAPYHWIAGIEGFEGKYLAHENFHRRVGPCLGVIERDGIYKKGDNPAELLRPFFEEVFDQCGARRPTSTRV